MTRAAIVATTALAFAAANGCKYPSLPALGGDGGSALDGGGSDAAINTSPYLLAALEPQIAPAGATLALEGIFDPSGEPTVTFPGGATAQATLLGANRATVVVPTAAGIGELTVTTGGATPPGVPFRLATFGLGVGAFQTVYAQPGVARQMTALAAAQLGHCAVAAGHTLFVVGGQDTATTVQSALIDADGTVGAFAAASSGLVTPRAHPTCQVIAGQLYVIGGMANSAAVGSIERAQIHDDGTLGTFATIAPALAVARAGATSAVIGDYLYVFGGADYTAKNVLDSIERAPILPDGSLGAFASAGTLSAQRAGHTSLVSGNEVYAIGGFGTGATSVLASVEAAPIMPDGTLGAFAAVSGVTLATGVEGAAGIALGGYYYAIGGDTAFGADQLATVQRAPIHTDGTLGAFATVAGAALPNTIVYAAAAVAGNQLYVLGGGHTALGNNLFAFASVWCAPIDADSGIGPFATVAGATLPAATTGAVTAAIGGYVYSIGGSATSGTTTQAVTTIYRAAIGDDGGLGGFVPYAISQLTTPRAHAIGAVVGPYVYVLGGDAGGAALTSIERARINPDGSIGQFAVVDGVTLMTARTRGVGLATAGVLYVIGGAATGSGSAVATIEQSTIAATGDLGAFDSLLGDELAAPRADFAAVLAGSNAYVFGGDTGATTDVTTVEAGPLREFAAVSGVTLVTPRAGLAAALAGGALLAIGGRAGATLATEVDAAPLSGSGALADFTTTHALGTARLPAAVEIGNHVYVFGGGATSIEAAPLP